MRRAIAVWGLLLLGAETAHAQRVLSLQEALDLARRGNRDLTQARARVEAAQAQVGVAMAALLPTASAQGKYTLNYKEVQLDFSASNQPLIGLASALGSADPGLKPALDQFSQQLSANTPTPAVIQARNQLDGVVAVTVPLVEPFAYPAVSSAKRAREAQEKNLEASDATVLLVAAQDFFAAAGSDEVVVARQHAAEVARSSLGDAKARAEAGTVNRVEVARAELQVVRAEQALVEAVASRNTTYRALATVIQLREPFRVAPTDPPVTELGSPDRLAEEALTLRPEIAALDRTLAADQATADSNLWRWAPTLSGFGNLRGFNYAGFSGDHYSWALGLQLDWALYDGGIRDAQRHLALAQKREVLERQLALRDTVRDDVRNAHGNVYTRQRALDTATRSVALSKETLELVRAQHEAGTATQLDLLKAQDDLVGSEVALAQARFDLALAALTLQRNAGLFPPK